MTSNGLVIHDFLRLLFITPIAESEKKCQLCQAIGKYGGGPTDEPPPMHMELLTPKWLEIVPAKCTR